MRATGFSVYCFALASLNKGDTYVHQAKTMWKINASRLPWETRWQLMLTINFWQSITKLIWIQDNLVYENQITDYSNRTEGAIGIHLFQLRLLQRRMMHDAWSMFHSPAVHYCGKSSKLFSRNEPRNLDSKGCWHFYVMSAER